MNAEQFRLMRRQALVRHAVDRDRAARFRSVHAAQDLDQRRLAGTGLPTRHRTSSRATVQSMPLRGMCSAEAFADLRKGKKRVSDVRRVRKRGASTPCCDIRLTPRGPPCSDSLRDGGVAYRWGHGNVETRERTSQSQMILAHSSMGLRIGIDLLVRRDGRGWRCRPDRDPCRKVHAVLDPRRRSRASCREP